MTSPLSSASPFLYSWRYFWPSCGWAGSMMPGIAPSLPASQDPARLDDLAVFVLGRLLAHVPDIALPCLGRTSRWCLRRAGPWLRAVSRTTRAVMPLANFFVSVVATTAMSCGGLPSSTLR